MLTNDLIVKSEQTARDSYIYNKSYYNKNENLLITIFCSSLAIPPPTN